MNIKELFFLFFAGLMLIVVLSAQDSFRRKISINPVLEFIGKSK